MSNTHKNKVPTGKDIWVKPYTKKDICSSVFSWDSSCKKIFRKKEKAVLKAELIREVKIL